ncbi:MAG: hypothetical protein KME57_13090 [Scytonema hyalinum WJT4-NPBG1]|nr:hypothetical protein [Scytonema hyalinum WJT4-NPBG1]
MRAAPLVGLRRERSAERFPDPGGCEVSSVIATAVRIVGARLAVPLRVVYATPEPQ